jgi:hypothetical protein
MTYGQIQYSEMSFSKFLTNFICFQFFYLCNFHYISVVFKHMQVTRVLEASVTFYMPRNFLAFW